MSKSIQEQKVELFARTYNLEQEIVQAQELQKDLKSDFQYHKEFNTNGLAKEDVQKVMKAAKSKAKQEALKEKAEALMEIDSLITELEG